MITNKKRYHRILCFLLTGLLAGCVHAAPGVVQDSVMQEPELLWSVPTGSSGPYSDNAGKVSCSYDGERVVAGYGAGIIEVYNRQGDLMGRWQSDRAYYSVWSVGISRDGSRVVSVLNDPQQAHMAKVVYLDQHGRLVWEKTLESPSGFPGISEDGGVVAVADQDRISFYDRAGNRTGTKVLEGMIWYLDLAGDGSSAVAGVTLRDDSGKLYVIGNNGTIEWFSPTPHRIRAVAISGNGEYLAGSDTGQLRFFARNQSRVWKYNSSTQIVSLAISSDGGSVAAGAQYYLRYFDRNGKMLWQYEDPGSLARQGAYFTHVAMTGNGEYVATTTRDNTTLLFSRQGKMQREIASRLWISDICLSGNGNALAIGTGREIRYFDTGIPAQPDARPPSTTQPLPQQTYVPATSQKSPVSVITSMLCIVIAILSTIQSRK
jgi:WD40 repeat protein